MEKLTIYASPLPFSDRRVRLSLKAGKTMGEIIHDVCAIDGLGAIATINGYDIPRKYWHRVRPKPGTIINVRIVPMGGSRGGKNPIASILSLAVIVAAPYAGAALSLNALNAGIGLTAGQGIFLGKVLTVGAGAIGLLAVNALAPPPKPSNLGNISNPSESPTQFIEGANNSLNPYGVVPICLGTNRMFPPQAAKPFTESENNDQYVRQLFTYGYGNVVCTDFKIGETTITEFSDLQLEHRLNSDLNQSTSLYSNAVSQENFNVLLSQAGGYVVRQTGINVDEAIIDVTFPQGLASFNASGGKDKRTVQVEVQYSNVGDSPDIWSPAATFTSVNGASFAVPVAYLAGVAGTSQVGYRRDIFVIDRITGIIRRIQGTSVSSNPVYAVSPVVSSNDIRLATALIKSIRPFSSSTVTTTIESLSDDRQPSLFGSVFQNSIDFAVSNIGMNVSVAAGNLINPGIVVIGAQTEAIRRSLRIVFPEKGTFNIRLRRITSDSASDQIFDEVYLTAIKSVRYRAPVNQSGISGTAARIRATNQLNGSLDTFNCVVSLICLDYNPDTGLWVEQITSNPASLYRYVLQCAANSKALPDSKIDISALEDWHVHCTTQGYSYNRVIDYETSLADVLQDIASAGAASPAIVDGKRSIVIDRIKSEIVQMITPRNSWAYSGQITYPELPHAFRVNFRNATKGYQVDERIVYDDGFNEFNATEFESLELMSCTNSTLAFKTGRRHIASIRLRPETHTFMMDIENLVANRGDRIKFAHDVPIIGIGDGRIKEFIYSSDSPTTITGIVLDDVISFPLTGNYFARIRRSDASFLYTQITLQAGQITSEIFFITPVNVSDGIAVGDLCYIVEAGGELDLIITRIEPMEDLSAKITAVDYAPAIFTAESAPIPNFNSLITTPIEFIRPLAPILVEAQSDESVASRQSDGTILSRAVFTLVNNNEQDVLVSINVRRSGTTAFFPANTLEASPDRISITGLDAGSLYDIWIFYRRIGGQVFSLPLQINNFQFQGLLTAPADVQNFVITVSGDVAIFRWDANTEIDISHYKLRFSNAFSGATYQNAQTVENVIYENRITIPFQGGTYFIKAVDLQGRESVNAAQIVTYDPGLIANVVETITENPGFAGVKDNVQLYLSSIILGDPMQDGYYYFEDTFNLGAFYESILSASITASALYFNDIFEMDDIFAVDDIFGSGQNDIFAMDDIFAVDDVFGIGQSATEVQLQYRTIDSDPMDSPAVYSDWQEFQTGSIGFWAIQFRLRMRSFMSNVSPRVTALSVRIDMPDRIERGEDITVPVDGITITFDPEFRATPSVNVTIQSGDGDDAEEITGKTSGGFTLKVYNKAAGAYVERVCDYIVSGYGRKS